MIKTEYPYIDYQGQENDKFIRHYSDEGYKLRQKETGELYDNAVDLFPCRFTYEETDEPIDKPEPIPPIPHEEEEDWIDYKEAYEALAAEVLG